MIQCYDQNNQQLGFGSGMHIGNGLFLTNLHVVAQEGAKQYSIVTNTGHTYPAEGIVKYDPDYDLAIVKASPDETLPAIKTGNFADVLKGESIIAIGIPEGLQNTVSEGIVSSKRPTTIENKTINLIQFTASITFGSSGGAVFNMFGEVIGVATFGFEGQGNLNFAVSIDHALPWIKELKGLKASQIQVAALPTELLQGGVSNTSNTNSTQPSIPEKPYAPSTPTPTPVPKPASFLNGFEIEVPVVTDAVLHPGKSKIYITDAENKKLYEIDLKIKTTKFVTFQLVPESLFLHGNELYVALLKNKHSYYDETADNGSIAIIDTGSFKLIEQFDINIDPYDILVGKDGYLYVTSGSNQWTDIKSYSLQSKQEVSSSHIRMQSPAELHPVFNRIYTISTDSSPRDYEAFDIDDGNFKAAGYDSPYHGDYTLNAVLKYLLTGSTCLILQVLFSAVP